MHTEAFIAIYFTEPTTKLTSLCDNILWVHNMELRNSCPVTTISVV